MATYRRYPILSRYLYIDSGPLRAARGPAREALNLLVRNMQAYSGVAKTRLRRIRRKSDRVSDSTMKEISSKVEPMGTIDYYGRLRLSRRVNEELRRVGLDHLTTEEATTHAREIKFVKASQASTSNT